MNDHSGVLPALFSAANIVIVAGYLAVPFLVLRYLPLTRTCVILCGAGFFAGCAGTHTWMAFGMPHEHGGWTRVLDGLAHRPSVVHVGVHPRLPAHAEGGTGPTR
jgi:hypothetical protein